MNYYTTSLPNATPIKAITARATYGIGFLTAIVSWFCMLFGMPNRMYAEKLKKTEALAMNELEQILKSIHADGLMDMRCQIDGLTFLITGTAYKLSADDKAKHKIEEKSVPEIEEIPMYETEEDINNEFLDDEYIDIICPECKKIVSCLKCDIEVTCPCCDRVIKQDEFHPMQRELTENFSSVKNRTSCDFCFKQTKKLSAIFP
jgi:uncharacterized protein YbjQ (UPF0145 family)